MNEVADLIGAVAAARQRVFADISGLSEDDAIWKPVADEWSVAQVVEHLTLAEHGGVLGVWQAADGVGNGRPIWQGDAVFRGRTIEAIIAATWRAREDAPGNTIPQANGPLAYWVAAFAACQPVLEALGRTLNGLDLEAIIAPHAISGPLDARQHLKFLRWHMDHHRRQIADIMAQRAVSAD